MHTQSKYKQMVVYVEACESGSMFQGILPTNINGTLPNVIRLLEAILECFYVSTPLCSVCYYGS